MWKLKRPLSLKYHTFFGNFQRTVAKFSRERADAKTHPYTFKTRSIADLKASLYDILTDWYIISLFSLVTSFKSGDNPSYNLWSGRNTRPPSMCRAINHVHSSSVMCMHGYISRTVQSYDIVQYNVSILLRQRAIKLTINDSGRRQGRGRYTCI